MHLLLVFHNQFLLRRIIGGPANLLSIRGGDVIEGWPEELDLFLFEIYNVLI